MAESDIVIEQLNRVITQERITLRTGKALDAARRRIIELETKVAELQHRNTGHAVDL